jgi:hypothetical protein|tara:strand:- start:1523 stop:2428 length:906 start_codon:yes stop_codon:yes gene_type:complete
MKSFKGYLQEAPAWTESLSTALFDLPRAGLKDVLIPLSSTIFKRVWPDAPPRTTVFHLTDLVGVKKLKRLQGRKKSISAFWNISNRAIVDGIRTEGGYIVELKGDIIVAGPDDISSQPDKSGRRWMTLSTLMNKPTASDPGLDGDSTVGGMESDIEEMLIEIIMKYADDPQHMPDVNKSWIALGKEYGGRDKEDKKIKSQIIGDYLDGIEKVMKKYSSKLRKVFLDYSKKRILEQDPDSGDVAEWDEIVVNNIDIDTIHVTPSYASDFAEDDDIYGFPFELYDNAREMTKYINKTVKTIKL